jgi:tetratricopeptide (TPR) repeat protein
MGTHRQVHGAISKLGFVFLIVLTLLGGTRMSAQCQPAAKSPATPANTSATPQFYDEPQFTVAGVSDASNLGGHGSDVMVRTDESLAKETVSLGKGAMVSSATAKSIPELEAAAGRNPNEYAAGYALAAAYADAGRLDDARAKIQPLLARQDLSPQDQASLHHLLGGIEERRHNPLEAVREYQRAAELNPSEPNLFDWGTELLLHRAAEPAAVVFAKGNRLFPQSARMLIGIGVSWHVRGAFQRAVDCLCQASDLNPNDPTPYLFLGKMGNVDAVRAMGYLERMERFARLQPNNALAKYYYATALWKRSETRDAATSSQVESLLDEAVELDPKLAAAYLQLGILKDSQADYAKAIAAYKRAIEIDPLLEEAHYRLGLAYRRTGDGTRARYELKVHQQLSKKSEEQFARERHEIQQFVISLRDKTSPAPNP